MLVKGVSSPKAYDNKTRFKNKNIKRLKSINTLAIPIAIAVFPVPGYPAIRIDLPAIFPSLIMLKISPAALLASF